MPAQIPAPAPDAAPAPAPAPDPDAAPDPAPTSAPSPTIALWPTLRFADVDTMMTWLAALGFTERMTYREEGNPAVVEHAEWLWPGGGGIMFGSAQTSIRHEAPGEERVGAVGSGSIYLVTDDPAAAIDRALAVGGSVIQPVEAQDYGGVNGTVRDPEGNIWSIGSYQPE